MLSSTLRQKKQLLEKFEVLLMREGVRFPAGRAPLESSAGALALA